MHSLPYILFSYDDSSNIHRVSTIWWNIFVSLKLVVRRTQLIYVYLCYWNCCISRDDETPNPTPSECLNYVESCFEALSFDLSHVLFIWTGRSMQLQHISILRYLHSVRARRICICLSILSLTLKFGSFTSSAAPTYMESTDVASPTACKWLERTCCWQIISFTPAHTYFSLLRSTAPTYIVPTTPRKCFYWCSTCIES